MHIFAYIDHTSIDYMPIFSFNFRLCIVRFCLLLYAGNGSFCCTAAELLVILRLWCVQKQIGPVPFLTFAKPNFYTSVTSSYVCYIDDLLPSSQVAGRER